MDPSFISSTRRLAIFISYSLIFSSPLFGKCYGAPENCTAASVNDADVRSYVVAVSSLLLEEKCACNDTKMMMKGADDELELVHTDNPCSKRGGAQQKAGAPHQSIIPTTFSRDQSRINWLLSAPNNVGRTTQLSSTYADRAFEVSQAVTLPTTYWQPPSITNLYVVKINLGSPPQPLSVLFDTGSGILWTQCEPCLRHCYTQREPIFDPKTSTTYTNFTCHSRACRELNATTAAGCFRNTTCSYGIAYGSVDTYSSGFWAEDTLTLTRSAVFKNIRFGCGQRNNMTGNATIAGILGLTRDSVSVVSQTADTYDQVFSYCFPSKPCFSGFLKFGRSCVTAATKFTPLKKNPPKYPSYYFIELTGISVAGKKIRVNRTVLTTADTIIDSGTTLTYLPSLAYAALSASFREEMKHYPLLSPSETNDSSLDTCYDLSNRDTVRVPSISLFFDGGVVVSIPPSGILLAGSDSDTGKKIGCLAFADNKNFTDGLTIIGYTQQQTHAVIYDVGRGRIGFGPKGCP